MGNRAVIATEHKDIGVYLHWNGGRDSVEAFLAYCKLKKFRPPEVDIYGWARLTQVIANFFAGNDGVSVGIGPYDKLDTDNWDNGVYIIENWKIIGREYYECDEEQNEHDLKEMLKYINACQPIRERIPIKFIENLNTEEEK